MSIVLERITKRYDGTPVVHGVSLDVADGELFVLLGPSGSGKSTILRAIAGLTDISAGRVWLHGRDVTRLMPQERGVGFVFQQYALFAHMTVADNVEFGLSIRRVEKVQRRQRREELLALVGLAGLDQRLPRQLSGGQQQRVAIARALATKPEVLLLDEPFGALDSKIRVELRQSLRQIQRELGVTTIFVTHDQEEAFELGDRLGVMNAGELLEVGKPDDIYLRPKTLFAATFLGTANLLEGRGAATGVEIGPLQFAWPADASRTAIGQPVRVLCRPEDIEIAPTTIELTSQPFGQAIVEQQTFVGTYERLRLRLPSQAGVQLTGTASTDGFTLDATRSSEQARSYPLRPLDTTWVGIQRIHPLPAGSELTPIAAPASGHEDASTNNANLLALPQR